MKSERLAGFLKSRLTIDTLWLLLVPLALMSLLNLTVVYPNDFWWHVRVGQIILAEGHIPNLDRFSFTRQGLAWVNQAWVMQVSLYLLYKTGGLQLVILAHALTITAGYSLVLRAVTRYYGLRTGVLATLVGTALGILNWAPRPQTISFFFFGLLIYLIESHRHGQTRRLWWAVPMFAVWANSHGGFIFGIAGLGFYVLGRLWEFCRPAGANRPTRQDMLQLVSLGLLACAALALNPQGARGLVEYVLSFVKSDATTQYNLEFLPLVIRQLDGVLFFAASVFLVTALVAASRQTGTSGLCIRPDQVLSVLAFGTLALLARRNAPWYGFVLAPVLATALRAWWTRPRPPYPGKAWINGLIVVLMGACWLASMPWWREAMLGERGKLVTDTTPTAATAFLCATLPDDARVYQYLAFSSYQIWACPRLPVFMDTRFELYPLDQWLDYMAIEKGRFDWESLASKYRLTHLFLSPKYQEQAVRAVTAAKGWHEIYRDKQAVIFEASSGE